MLLYVDIFFPVSFLVYPSHTCFPPTTAARRQQDSKPRRKKHLAAAALRPPRLYAPISKGTKEERGNPQNEALTEQEELASFPLDLVRKLTLTFVGAAQYKRDHQGARRRRPGAFSSFLRPFSSPSRRLNVAPHELALLPRRDVGVPVRNI